MDLHEIVIKGLWIMMALVLLALFDELERPGRPTKKPRSGVVHWDESRGSDKVTKRK